MSDVNAIQAIKDSKMASVLAILFTTPTVKIADACRSVGVDYDSFRYWSRTHPDFISNMRELLGEFQKEQLLSVELAWSAGLQILMETVANKDTGAALRLEIHKYLGDIRDDLFKTYHAEPGIEEEAQKFLSQGPQVQRQESRFASVEVSKTADGVLRLDVFQPTEVIDLVPQEESSPQSKDNPPPPPENT